ncbi:hypothetical protein ACIQI8_22325 [Streptomyces sp. NPDC092369]|uniref:hypothetical protein n=1 Tax=Streptomyces sp. NPDC092369 TaxID=3366015 RepID=UPI0037F97AC0
MGRYVHQELLAALAMLTGIAVGVAVSVGIRDDASLHGRGVAVTAALAVAFLVVSVLLRSSRLKWVGEVREFEAAGPRPGADVVPRDRAYSVRMVVLFVLAAVLTSFLGVAVVIPLAMGLDWLTKAVVAARWERRHGRVLWRGHNRDEPWKLSYSPVSPPRATRTATDGPAV